MLVLKQLLSFLLDPENETLPLFLPCLSQITIINCSLLLSPFYNGFSGPTQKMNLFQSVTSALDNTLASDPTAGRMLEQEMKYYSF